MEMISEQKLNEIRKSVDIVDIISEYVPLTKRGKNFFGICPFHNDNNPSMSVSNEKQIYKCFSCGASGNVFTFLQNYENITFIEAVKKVADKANIDLNINTKVKQNKNEKLYEIYNTSLKLYQNNINTKEGLEAKEYLKKRKIDEDLIKEFEIGLSLKNNKVLTEMLIKKGFSYEDINKSGLAVKNDFGYSDIYYDRIMFPLHDLNGKVVGYSGRVYNKEDQSKYINTRETEIFKKGELLYNSHRAKDHIRKEDSVIIVEGFMDVIRCFSIGVKNCIALMGTSMTKTQANLIRKLSRNVILCFDGDAAGEKATESASMEFINMGITPKIIRLEENLDPDDYIIKKGTEKFKEKLTNPMTVTDFKLNYYKKGKNLSQAEDQAAYINEVIKSLNEIDDDILREITLNKISEEAKIDINLLKSKIVKQEKKEEVNKQIKLNKYQKAEMFLLYYMANSNEVAKMYEHKLGYLPTKEYRELARSIVNFYEDNADGIIADLINYLDEDLLKTLNTLLDLNLKDNYSLEEINDYIETINEYNVKNEIQRLRGKLKEADFQEQEEILKKIVELIGVENDK